MQMEIFILRILITNVFEKIDRSTKVTSIAGDGTTGYLDGLGSKAKFKFPRGIAWDNSGNIYVADTNNYCIRRLTSKDGGKNWQVDTIAGSTTGTAGFKDGTGKSAKFDRPYGIVCDAASNLYVADTFNNRIRRITSKDRGKSWQVDTIAGSSTALLFG
jgi:sugar lactone lactonase YvrE